DPAGGLALAPADPRHEVEDLTPGDERQIRHAAQHTRREVPHRAAPRERHAPVVKAHREPLELDARARDRLGPGGERAPRRDDPRRADPRMAEGEAPALDLEAVTATVDDVVDRDPGSDICQRAPREDRQAGAVA